MADTYNELKAALEALNRASELIYQKPDFEREYDYYKEVQYQIEEAQDAVRGAIALT